MVGPQKDWVKYPCNEKLTNAIVFRLYVKHISPVSVTVGVFINITSDIALFGVSTKITINVYIGDPTNISFCSH